MIINGKATAERILDALALKIQKLRTQPRLVAILVGDNPSSLAYIRQKRRFAERVGIEFQLNTHDITVTEEILLGEIQKLNNDDNVSGFIVQLPLPKHIDRDKIIEAIDPKKDVDGFTAQNIGELFLGRTGLSSCTPKGVMRLLQEEGISVAWKNVVIIGKSNIVGKPLSLLMMNVGATITVCSKETRDIAEFTRNADIIVVAAGVPKLLKKDMVRPGVVIIDVGITLVEGKLQGDADFTELEPITTISTVPGGVGPMTVAMLMENTYLAALNQE